MSVRAKVRCTKNEDSEVNFETVYEQPDERDTENMRFTEATPWGEIRLGINNESARKQFEVGKEYYCDFTPADSPAAEPAPAESAADDLTATTDASAPAAE